MLGNHHVLAPETRTKELECYDSDTGEIHHYYFLRFKTIKIVLLQSWRMLGAAEHLGPLRSLLRIHKPH